MAEQLSLLGEAVPLEVAQRQEKGNPLLPIYGPGPEGSRCGDCVHLYRKGGIAKHVLKCDLRRNTDGEATDHRAKWPACGRFVAGIDESRERFRG